MHYNYTRKLTKRQHSFCHIFFFKRIKLCKKNKTSSPEGFLPRAAAQSTIQRLTLCYGFQIDFRFAVEYQLSVVQRCIIDRQSNSDRWYILFVTSFSTAMQSMEISIPSSRRCSTQAVSVLNSQDRIFLILVTSQHLNFR